MKIIGLREYELAWGEGSAAIVLYEDYRSGCVGKAFVEWIGASEGGDLGGRLGLWRFDILDLPGVDTEVCEGLARADLLVVSVRPGSDVPESISAKVAAWGERLVDPTLPIVVLGGVCAAEAPRMVGLRSLRRWAGRLGMPMVCESVWPPPGAAGWLPDEVLAVPSGLTAGTSRFAGRERPGASIARPSRHPASFPGSAGWPTADDRLLRFS